MSSDDHSGTFWSLVGFAALVFVGVGLSLAIDRYSDDQRDAKDISEVIRRESDRKIALSEQLERGRRAVEQQFAPRLEVESQLADLLPELESREEELGALRERAEMTRSEIDTLLANYDAHRKQIWADANGETYPSIQLRSGQTYSNATIRKVTGVGLEISHTDGLARIQASELDDTWNDRFQWKDSERLALLKSERHQAPAPPLPTAIVPDEKTIATARKGGTAEPVAVQSAEVQKLLIDLAGWNQKITNLTSDYRHASNQASRRDVQSVPGSLETWGARAQRLQGELSRARSARSQVKISLRTLGVEPPPDKPGPFSESPR
jgi:hypothetical protein